MPASDEFPRGLSLAGQASNAALSLTFPAIPGISWVLTDIDLSVTSTNTTTEIMCSATDQASRPYITFGVSEATSTSYGTGAGSWAGKVCYPLGSAVTISIGGIAANVLQTLHATAYPI